MKNSTDEYFESRILSLKWQCIILAVILMAIVLFATACQKDYSTKPSPFKIGDKVKLNGINPRNSPQPYDCCTCPCTITNAYLIQDQVYWWYDLVDLDGHTLTHVDNKQLKKY